VSTSFKIHLEIILFSYITFTVVFFLLQRYLIQVFIFSCPS